MLKTKKLLEEVWRFSKRYIRATEKESGDGESGRVGEALGCPAPLEKRGFALLETRHRAGAPAKAGKTLIETAPSKAPNTRPTDN